MKLRSLTNRLPRTTGDANKDLQSLIAALSEIFRATRETSSSTDSWTPVLAGSTTAGSQTYAYASGSYTKSDQVVHFEGAFLLTAFGGTTDGNMRITGLPFAAKTGPVAFSVTVGLHQQVNLSAGYSQVTAVIQGGNSYIELKECGDAVNERNIDDTQMANTTAIWVSGFYFV